MATIYRVVEPQPTSPGYYYGKMKSDRGRPSEAKVEILKVEYKYEILRPLHIVFPKVVANLNCGKDGFHINVATAELHWYDWYGKVPQVEVVE